MIETGGSLEKCVALRQVARHPFQSNITLIFIVVRN